MRPECQLASAYEKWALVPVPKLNKYKWKNRQRQALFLGFHGGFNPNE